MRTFFDVITYITIKPQTERAFDDKKTEVEHYGTLRSLRMEKKGRCGARFRMRDSVWSSRETGGETCGMRNGVRSRGQTGREACGMRNSVRSGR